MGVIKAQSGLFSILPTVDSSNNYATGAIHEGLAKHGQAWFALEQTAGKGQRGKHWISIAGENLILSIVIRPGKALRAEPFMLSMITANICRNILADITHADIFIKWPNDIYWSDRKTGGILIENIYKGHTLEWSVIGIGININQCVFEVAAGNAASVKQIIGKDSDPIIIAKRLHENLLHEIDNLRDIVEVCNEYNGYLYKKEQVVRLKKQNSVFKTKISGVNKYGQLLTKDIIERTFEVGDVEWIPPEEK